jgi:hypothetical protein
MGAEGSSTMQVRRSCRSPRRLSIALGVTSAVLGAVALAGCGGHSGGSTAAARPVRCGTSRTAAHVPVDISVSSAGVSCSSAMTIEQAYASAIRDGKAPGAGGNGPVHISGWTCSTFSTPEVLKTGNASKCVKGSTEILATLPT